MVLSSNNYLYLAVSLLTYRKYRHWIIHCHQGSHWLISTAFLMLNEDGKLIGESFQDIFKWAFAFTSVSCFSKFFGIDIRIWRCFCLLSDCLWKNMSLIIMFNLICTTAGSWSLFPFSCIIWYIRWEVNAQKCSVKKVFLEISQNSHENTCVRVFF